MGKYAVNFLVSMVIITIVCAGISDHSVQAKSIQDYEKELKELETESGKLNTEKSKLQKNKSSIKSEMDENIDSQNSVESQVETIEAELNETQSDIDVKENDIAITMKEIEKLNAEVEKLKEEIQALQERIEKREELLIERLRAIQENGGNVKYLSVIMGAESFSDLITRSSAVNSIMDQDKNIMEEHAADKKELETKESKVKEKKVSVEDKKADQEKQKENLLALKHQLDDQKAEKRKIQETLVAEFDDLEEKNLSIEEEQALIASQAEVLKGAKQEAQSKKSDLEAKAAEEAAKKSQSNTGGGSQVSDSGPVMNAGNGSFIMPVGSGYRLTSGFGSRIHPITGKRKNHNGLDIAPPSPGQKVPIYAADSGIVTFAGWMGGYGNVVMISHGKLTTLYAHLDSSSVSNGQSVSQGSQIAVMGTTGGSKGVHLHFEVHPGGYPNAVNPTGYLP